MRASTGLPLHCPLVFRNAPLTLAPKPEPVHNWERFLPHLGSGLGDHGEFLNWPFFVDSILLLQKSERDQVSRRKVTNSYTAASQTNLSRQTLLPFHRLNP